MKFGSGHFLENEAALTKSNFNMIHLAKTRIPINYETRTKVNHLRLSSVFLLATLDYLIGISIAAIQ
jgi:hypothetical protein